MSKITDIASAIYQADCKDEIDNLVRQIDLPADCSPAEETVYEPEEPPAPESAPEPVRRSIIGARRDTDDAQDNIRRVAVMAADGVVLGTAANERLDALEENGSMSFNKKLYFIIFLVCVMLGWFIGGLMGAMLFGVSAGAFIGVGVGVGVAIKNHYYQKEA